MWWWQCLSLFVEIWHAQCWYLFIFLLLSITLNKGKERWSRRKEKGCNSWHERAKMSRVSITCYFFLLTVKCFRRFSEGPVGCWRALHLSHSALYVSMRKTEISNIAVMYSQIPRKFVLTSNKHTCFRKHSELFLVFTMQRKWRELRGKWQISWILLQKSPDFFLIL